MDIRKKESCSVILYLALVGAIMLMAEGVSFADTRTPTKVLIATYKSAPAVTPAEAESAIASLEKVLSDCEDGYLAFRIRYRIGVMYFKARMMEASKTRFQQVGNDPMCPQLIRACSFNMVGQISRLQGQNKKALEAFERVANLLEQRLSVGREVVANTAFAKLWCSALFSKAEIYELQRDYAASITAYDRLFHVLRQNKNEDVLGQYAPLVNDRISQLHIRRGDIDKYTEVAEALTKDHPEYYRTPIVKLEVECVKLLRSTSANHKFINGSFAAPSELIALLTRSKGGTLAQHICDKLDSLCKERQNTYEGVLLQYHYAWFLDTLGEKGKAAEILARILSSDVAPANNGTHKKAVIETVQEYAKIQYAIMAGERADYNEALRVLGSLRTHPDKPHISELAKSVGQSIQILKREVPKNENE